MASTAIVALVAATSAGVAQSPQAPTVAAGSIAVTRHGQTTVVTQGTDRGIIDWRSFSIGPQETVRFDQPGRSAVTLNRVTGAETSRIDGNLSATGQVWLANPNGVMIGPGGQVNVGGLLATTGRIDSTEFLRSGRALIDQIPTNGRIVNAGSILARDGGYAALAAAAAENRGVIQARTGMVAMGAGKAMTLDFAGDKLIQFQVTQPLDQKPDGTDALVSNAGTLAAQGGTVALSARAAKGVIDNVINLKGHVIADVIRVDGGRVLLGDGGKVQVEGHLDASNPAGAGGKLEIGGPEVTIAPTAILNASGSTGGGAIEVKAAAIDVKPKAQIAARATEAGNGGRVSLRADQSLAVAAPITVRGGEKAGDGGAIEAASAGSAALSSALIADAPAGRGGAVLVAGGLTVAMTGAQISAVGLTGGGMISIGAYLSDAGYVVAAPRLLSLTDSVIDASVDFNAPTEMARILDDGRMINVTLPRAAFAAARGGAVALAGKSVTIAKESAVRVRGRDAQIASLGAKLQADAVNNGAGNGGRIDVAAEDLTHQGRLDASGAQGGTINLAGQAVFHSGSVTADGGAGKGGNATIVATVNYQATASATLQAKGKTEGGTARILGTADGTDSAPAIARVFTSGTITAQGETGRGGTADILGRDILLVAAQIDASGATGGGAIRVGGDWQGSGALAHAKTVLSTGPTTFTAAALKAGEGGKVVVWSDESTRFGSRVLAKGGGGGAGGAVEVSSKGALTYGGAVEAATLLLDPKNIVIDASVGGISSVALTDPGAGGSGYGTEIKVLPNGNIVVTSPNDSSGGVTNRGAAYLFNGSNGSLISSLTGSNESDKVSNGGITVLSNANYLVRSPNWSIGGITANVGAITWGSGTTGVIGEVSTVNSLVGSTANDQVGAFLPTALVNGNYVVLTPNWNRGGTAANAGAVTWGNGTSGTTGVISAANSLVGSSVSDRVGRGGAVALTNGSYVVSSWNWNRGGTVANAGAVTWGDGTIGVVGPVSVANSLVGSTADDNIGFGGVTALTNGNYVTASPSWKNGGVVGSTGAVTWGNGTTGIAGAVSAANSLVGAKVGNFVTSISRNGSITALANGNFVVADPSWKNGTGASVGAVTWGNGTTGIAGPVSSANSLVGSTDGDSVGGDFYGTKLITALTNGNYVVSSPYWNNGGTKTRAGAVTWGNGTSGVAGIVSTANSLVGTTAYDLIGYFSQENGVKALTNGNFVVSSSYWNNGGAAARAGAVTWGDGTTGITGTVSAANSLVGTNLLASIGNGGVTALTNGNYIVRSTDWSDGTITGAGAVTWGNGSTGIKGFVSATNSLVGASAYQNVGTGGVVALTNGNYVVATPGWRNDGIANFVGAVTWGDGATGTTGPVSTANSLVGSKDGDQVGVGGVTALTNGNYVVTSYWWNNGAGAANTGAVTWGNGSTGIVGAVSSTNSVVGASANSLLALASPASGNSFVVRDSFGGVRLAAGGAAGSGSITAATFTDSPSSDVTLSAATLASTLAAGTKVSLQANNDITVKSAINVAGSAGGDLSLQAGRSVMVNAPIATANGKLTIIANERASNGVVDAYRDPGAGGITMASGTSINTGTGALILRVNDGAGLTHSTGGDIALQAITAGALTVENLGAGGVAVNGAATLGAASAIRAAKGDVVIANAMNVSGAGAAIDIDAGRDISLAATGAVTTQGGKISLLSDRDEVDGGKIRFEYGAALTSNGGDILLSGGADPTVGRAQGRGAYSGVRLYGNVIDAGDGAVTMRGAGTKESSNAELRGVSLEDSAITARGGLTLDGIGSSSSTAKAYGVRVINTTLDAGPAGAISITGVGTAVGDYHHGVYVSNSAAKAISFGSGGLSIKGTASQIGSGFGVWIEGVSNMAGPGDITLFGKGGTVDGATNTSGVAANMSGLIESTAGNITITGQRGLPRSRNVVLNGGGTFATVGGDLTINADYASDGMGAVAVDSVPAHGFRLRAGSTLTTSTGKIAIYGSAASGGVNAAGISIGDFSSNGTITATGAGGSILLVGKGAGGGAGVFANAAKISTLDGAIEFKTDSLSLTASSIGSSAGSTIIAPLTPTASIGVNGGAGDLQISSAALDQVAGNLVIGSTLGQSGAVEIGAGLLLKQNLTVASGADGIKLGAIDALTPGAPSLSLSTTGGSIAVTGALGGVGSLGGITSTGGVVVSTGPITIGAAGGSITAAIDGKTGTDAAALVNVTTGSKITVNGVTLPNGVTPPVVTPPVVTPPVVTTPVVTTPVVTTPVVTTPVVTTPVVTTPVVTTPVVTTPVVTTPVVTTPVVTTPVVTTPVVTTPVVTTPVVTTPVVTTPVVRTPVTTTPFPVSTAAQTQAPATAQAGLLSDLQRIQAQILPPPSRFDAATYADPEASADPLVAARAAGATAGRGGAGATQTEQRERAAQVGLNAAITLDVVRLTPIGGLIPPFSPLVPGTGAALTSAPTIRLDPVDSGGAGGQAIATSSGGSLGGGSLGGGSLGAGSLAGAGAAGEAGASSIKGLSFQPRRPASDANGRPPPLAETPSEINEEAFLD